MLVNVKGVLVAPSWVVFGDNRGCYWKGVDDVRVDGCAKTLAFPVAWDIYLYEQ